MFFNSPFSQLSKAEVSDDALDRRREHAAASSRSCYRRPDHGIRRFAIATNAGGRVARVLATVRGDSNGIIGTLGRRGRAADHGADGAGFAQWPSMVASDPLGISARSFVSGAVVPARNRFDASSPNGFGAHDTSGRHAARLEA